MAQRHLHKGANRAWKVWLPQIAVVLILLLGAAWLVGNMVDNLSRRGITVGFDFLDRAARFPVSESILAYSPTDSFGWAFVVGTANTLFISLLVIVSSSLLGLFIGLARRSRNPLAFGIATVFVDAMRNTPLVVQLLFWYAAVTFGLPRSAEASGPGFGIFLTDRGLYLPRLMFDGPVSMVLLVAAIGIAVWLGLVLDSRRRRVATGISHNYAQIAILGTLAAATLAWLVGGVTITLENPVLGRFNFDGGMTLTPEFVAILLGLVLYSTAFTGEIIRGGIDAIVKGQWEAGRAIGLSDRRTLRLVIVPQALRVIIPPMTSQYINIVKNSTLALVVGYPELNFVTATTINQTGQAVEGILVLMLVFLTISSAASLLMNWYNRRLALVQR